MFSEFENPLELSPAELDDYLARGWRPMGQSVYTCHFSLFGKNELYSTLCTRLPLANYQFRKSLRKLLRKNDQSFRVIARIAENSPEKEKLNKAYRRSFKDKAPQSLEFFIGQPDENIFPTYEIAVYDQDQLIALSFFDVGATSMYSKMGIYHPDYQKHSLGFYTMLKEIEFGLNHQKSYYYPGYVTPFYPMFDYKLRIGAVEYLDLFSNTWLPFDQLAEEDIPVVKMRRMLEQMQVLLKSIDIDSRLLKYRYFDIRLFNQNVNRSLRHPMFLICQSDFNFLHSPIIIYHPEKQKFQLFRVALVNEYYNNQQCHSILMAQKDWSMCEFFIMMAIEMKHEASTPEKMLSNIQEMMVK